MQTRSKTARKNQGKLRNVRAFVVSYLKSRTGLRRKTAMADAFRKSMPHDNSLESF